MSLDPLLLDVLVCPDNHDALHLAEPDVVERINARIATRRLRNRGGSRVEGRVDAALIRADGAYAYLIRDDIPIMLVDEAIALVELD